MRLRRVGLSRSERRFEGLVGRFDVGEEGGGGVVLLINEERRRNEFQRIHRRKKMGGVS